MLRLILCLLCFTAAAAADALPMWHVEGDNNNVYLLGSVHLLRESDYPLPDGIDAAYESADVLIMELDLDDMDPVAAQASVQKLGHIQDGRDLAGWLGAASYEQAAARANQLDIPLHRLTEAEPWLAAVTIEQMMLSRIGFDSSFGLESHLLRKAAQDSKEVLGLETLEQQLEFLDTLSIEAQRALLLETLEEAANIEAMMDSLVRAWRLGDIEFLEEHTLSDIARYPELYDALVVRRNRNWTEQIEALLDDGSDYLIIVGTLHLVGDDSVPAQLASKGHVVRER